MSGYPHNPSGYGYGQPPPSQPYSSAPYGGAPPSSAPPYSAPPQSQPYTSAPYGGAPLSSASPQAHSSPYGDTNKPPKDNTPPSAPYGGYPAPPHSGPYGSNPFSSLTPSIFPPGTDPNVISCFQMADQDGSGFIDDKELQKALSSYNQSFGLRTVHLLMYLFTNTNIRKIGPKEFTAVFYSLQNWRVIFERFDKDRSGKIDSSELREALHSLGYAVYVYGPVLECWFPSLTKLVE